MQPEPKSRDKLAKEAYILSQGHQLVEYRGTLYAPADYETLDYSSPPPPERCVWIPLSTEVIQRLAKSTFNTLFVSESELRNFVLMVHQCSDRVEGNPESLLIRTKEGLKELNSKGELAEVTGEFRPNTVLPMLNVDPAEKARVLKVVENWLDSEVEAESLLRHLATILAPGWSAVKYVLLLGDGRNGKSVLLKMIEALFGRDNVSHVARQHIAEGSPMVAELNGKLANIIYDGMAEYLKDSGAEKSLVAGEPAPVRLLYKSNVTMVQTTGLFLEGLNQEPKTKDKTSALQKRLVRFQFPNVYALDHKFEKSMLSEAALGAFLSLLIDRYVQEHEVAVHLAPTAKALELQMESMYANNLALQYLKYLDETDPLGADSLVGLEVSTLVKAFGSWRLKENDLKGWAEPDVMRLFRSLVETDRKSRRVPGMKSPQSVRWVTGLKPDARAFIESLKGEEDDVAIDIAMVEE